MKWWPVILLLIACNPSKKTQQADLPPRVDVYVTGDSIVTVDTNYYVGSDWIDTIYSMVDVNKTRNVVITKTVRVTDTITRYREDKRRVDSLTTKLKATELANQKLQWKIEEMEKKKPGKNLWWVYFFSGAFIGMASRLLTKKNKPNAKLQNRNPTVH